MKPPDSPVTVAERMERLELIVAHRQARHEGDVILSVDPLLPIPETPCSRRSPWGIGTNRDYFSMAPDLSPMATMRLRIWPASNWSPSSASDQGDSCNSAATEKQIGFCAR